MIDPCDTKTMGVPSPDSETWVSPSSRSVALTRRRALTMLTGAAASVVLPGQGEAQRARRNQPFRLTRADDAFLDDMERRACLYFVEQAGAESGQVLDRAAFYGNGGRIDPRPMASIAATGFGLTALCIGDRRGYLSHASARAQVLRTLRFHAEDLPHEHGFFYHFNDVTTGKPFAFSEVSSIDTALLLCGVLTARAHFASDPEIVRHATTIYERVDWPWMLNGGTLFRMGWNPERTLKGKPAAAAAVPKGKPVPKAQPVPAAPEIVHPAAFLDATWNHYCELMMIPLLALGSPTFHVDAEVWSAWSRPEKTYGGITYITGDDPLFTHQYSHAWFDFRGKHDAFTNYFDNSVKATRAHRAFCLGLGAPYAADYWGISASDSATGYQAWGGPPALGRLDGSVVPNATAGSLPFLPAECLAVQRHLHTHYADKGWNRYGFTDALNPDKHWYNADVLGIDLGIGMLMAENLRTGFVWQTFARNREAGIAMQRAGFRKEVQRTL